MGAPAGPRRPGWWAYRLSAVRGFTVYLHPRRPGTQVPPADLLPLRTKRATPYLYSAEDIAALMTAARGLRSPLLAATYETLIGLLAVTGLRIGESINLDRADVDLTAGCSPSSTGSSARAATYRSIRPPIERLRDYDRQRV